MAKLTLRTVKEKTCEDKENKYNKEETVLSPTHKAQTDSVKSPITPSGNFKNLKQQKLNFVECGIKAEASPPTVTETMTPPPTKRRRRSNVET